MNQCIKTGANVILTQENLAVHGDLYAVSDKDGSLTLVLHYVEPMKAVIRDQEQPIGPEYDAIFDTQQNFKDFGETDCLLTIESAKVMVCAPGYAFISKAMNIEDTVRSSELELHALIDAIFGGMGHESSEGETRQ